MERDNPIKKEYLIKGGIEEVRESLLLDYFQARNLLDENGNPPKFKLEHLKSGGFGDAFSFQFENEKEQVLKVIPSFIQNTEGTAGSFEDPAPRIRSAIIEILMTYHCRNQANAVNLLDVYVHTYNKENQDYAFLLFLDKYNELNSYYFENEYFTETEKKNLLIQIAEPLNYLHTPFCYKDELREITKNFFDSEGLDPSDYLTFDIGRAYRVLHLDIAPDNIFWKIDEQKQFRYYLGDFGGCSFYWDDAEGDKLITLPSKKENYSPPEVWFEERARISPLSDVYMLGAVGVYLSMSGKGAVGEEIKKRERIAGVSPGLSESLRRATEEKPEERFASVVDFRDYLRILDVDESIPVQTDYAQKALFAVNAGRDNDALAFAELGLKDDPDNLICARVFTFMRLLQVAMLNDLIKEEANAETRTEYNQLKKERLNDIERIITSFINQEHVDPVIAVNFISFVSLAGRNDLYSKAWGALKEAVASGYSTALYYYARCGRTGKFGVTISKDEMLRCFDQAIDKGSYLAIVYVAEKLEQRHVDFPTSEAYYAKIQSKLAEITEEEYWRSQFNDLFM